MKKNMEVKQLSGTITETKQEDRNGVPVGLISGHIATWDKDRGDDRFEKGAFVESIQDHMKRNNRPIRFKDNHGRTVGGFPISGVFEDDRGLFGTAEVNLDVQQGKELFALVKQGVISDFSIGFSAIDWEIKEGVRIIGKAIIWEGSAVDEPMNIAANIIDVKGNDDGIDVDELSKMESKELEEILRATGKFSRKACTIITSRFAKGQSESDEGNQSESGSDYLEELKKLNETFKGV